MSGPGARIVDRVGVAVIPDTSKFVPALRKYLARIERQRQLEINVRAIPDVDRFSERVRATTERVRRTTPDVEIPVAPKMGDFARRAKADIAAAAKSLEAQIPLTADGERMRRQLTVDVEKLNKMAHDLNVSVPLDVEAAAKAKAELRARIAAMQAMANRDPVTVPVRPDAKSLPGGGLFGLNPGAIAALAAAAAAAGGGVVATLPALIASIAAPIAAIGLGIEGIKRAASAAVPAFTLLKSAVSDAFAANLTVPFMQLNQALPKLRPQLQGIAAALSGAFKAIVDEITSPEGMAIIKSILGDVGQAIRALTPALGPLTKAFLVVAGTGMKTLAQMAPLLAELLTSMANVFLRLNESGAIEDAAKGFGILVISLLALIGVASAAMVQMFAWTVRVQTFAANVIVGFSRALAVIAAFPGRAVAAISTFVSGIVGRAAAAMVGFRGRIAAGVAAAVAVLSGVPARAAGAVAGMAGALSGRAAAASRALVARLRAGVASAVAVVRTLPARAAAAVSGLSGRLAGAGEQLVRGFIAGIRRMAGAAAAAARDMALSAVRAAKSALRINSPSRVFIPIGEQSGAGLVQGLTASRAAVASAGAGLARAAVPEPPAMTVRGGAGGSTGGMLSRQDFLTLVSVVRREIRDGVRDRERRVAAGVR